MEDKTLERAVEDIQLIRDVMDRSIDSLNLMYRVFICWGVTFTAIGAVSNLLCLLWPGLADILVQAPFLAIAPKLAMGISAIAIFLMFRGSMQDKGLNKQFLVLWLAIFSYDAILPSVNLLLMGSAQLRDLLQRDMYVYFVPWISLPAIALGMFCMHAFTSVKPFGWMALVSLLLFLILICISGTYAGDVVIVLLGSLVSPLTLLTVGILLRTRSQRKITFTV